MNTTLQTLRDAHKALTTRDVRLHEAAASELSALIADMEAQPEEQPKADDFEVRGLLAKSLKCWHRLTGEEAAELVEFVASVQPVECPTVKDSLTTQALQPIGYATHHDKPML